PSRSRGRPLWHREPMRISLSLSLIALAACTPAQDPRSPTPAAESATPAALAPPVRMVVTADDGFQLTMWRNAPAQPRRAVLLIHGRTWSGRHDFDLQVHGEKR